MVLSLMLSFLLVCAPAPAEGPKPTVEEVKVDDAGRPYLMISICKLVPVEKEVVVMEGGILGKTTVIEAIAVKRQTPFYLDTREVQVLNRMGKKLDPAAVRKMLAKGGKVLISADGNTIDPRHVASMSAGLVLVVSPSLVKARKTEEQRNRDDPIPAIELDEPTYAR